MVDWTGKEETKYFESGFQVPSVVGLRRDPLVEAKALLSADRQSAAVEEGRPVHTRQTHWKEGLEVEEHIPDPVAAVFVVSTVQTKLVAFFVA